MHLYGVSRFRQAYCVSVTSECMDMAAASANVEVESFGVDSDHRGAHAHPKALKILQGNQRLIRE
jgi:protein-tyrosine-phosphatase